MYKNTTKKMDNTYKIYIYYLNKNIDKIYNNLYI